MCWQMMQMLWQKMQNRTAIRMYQMNTDDSGQDNSDVDENLEEELGTEDVDQSE